MGLHGISTALYTKRANLKTLIISKGIGALEKVSKIENYYGMINPISGKELHEIGIKQAKELEVEIINDEVVEIKKENLFEVETINSMFKAKYVAIATGTARKQPKIEGIDKFEGNGISYCTTCDGFFFKNKKVGVFGSKEYAINELNNLKLLTNQIVLLTNGEELIENRNLTDDIKIETRRIKEFRGTKGLEQIEFEDSQKMDIDGVFIAEGIASCSDLARKIGATVDKDGNVKVNENMETTVPGLYACGDAVGGTFQVAKAVNDGMKVALSIIKKGK